MPGRLKEAQLPESQVVQALSETTTPTPVADVGKLYTKGDENLYFQDGSGNEHRVNLVGESTVFKSYTLGDPRTEDDHYLAGFYEAPAAHVVLTIGGPATQTYGTAGRMKAAHAFCVASGAGGADLVLTVSGDSIDDAGNLVIGTDEVIVADTDAAITDQYFETTKKWLGQVTYTLTGGAGSFTFNYGFCKYEDFGNRNFTVTDFEVLIVTGAAIADFEVHLLLHSPAGWAYSAAAFEPGGTVICSSLADQSSTYDNSVSGENFAYKRAGLSQAVGGDDGEGVVVHVHVSVNNAFEFGSVHVGVTI